jgi:hypothetical protein
VVSAAGFFMRFVLALFVLLLVCGCALPDVDIAFDPKAAAFIHQRGKTTIKGEAFFRAENGRVVYAAGEWVYLIPATPYSDARFASFFGDEKYLRATRLFLFQEADPRYRDFMRATKADSGGNFQFDQVGPGRYYIWTTATWIPDNWILPAGGLIYDKIEVSGHETGDLKVIVSGK